MQNNDLNKNKSDSGVGKPRLSGGNDRISLRWLSIGIEYAGVLGIFAYIGYQADKRFGTEPWLMISGLFLAMIGMTYLMFKETANWRK